MATIDRKDLDTSFVYNPADEPTDDEGYEDMFLRGVKPEELVEPYKTEYEAWITKKEK